MMLTLPHIAVAAQTPQQQSTALALARTLELDCLSSLAAAKDYDYVLICTPNYLGLKKSSRPR